ncbi:hypothetical protein OA07_25120 [Aphanizomenon flos-aquae 2012/KM1/D3]|nr:hypothetical protein OA07_25120 [Aphanizomenon flos-aquae 2012/KM1/D3]
MNFSLTQRRKDAKVRFLKVQFGNFIPRFSNAKINYPILWDGHPARPCGAGKMPAPQEIFGYFFNWKSLRYEVWLRYVHLSLTGGVSLRTACSSASLSPEALAITQQMRRVALSLNPTYKK